MSQRQIVVKAVDNQIDIECLVCVKYTIRFHYQNWMLTSVNVSLCRTNTTPQGFQSNHFITTTKLLMRSIYYYEHY